MYSIYSASGRFTTKVFNNHTEAFSAFKESGMMGIAFVVNEYDGVVEYDLVSDGSDHWCIKHELVNSRATAR